MRCVLSVRPEAFTTGLVFKKGLNLTALRQRTNKKLGFKELTFYSFRYAAAEEDKKGKIPEAWTRRRMGHSDTSNTKDHYARNKDNRVIYNEQSIPLGMDLFERPTNPQLIGLEFNVVGAEGLVHDTTWLDRAFANAPKGAKEDFEEVCDMVAAAIEKGEGLDALLARYEVFEAGWMELVPVGFNIALPSGLLPDDLMTLHTKNVEFLQGVFADVAKPKIVPELWSFPQVMYGNWRYLLADGIDTHPEKMIVKPPKPIMESKKRPREEEPNSDAESELCDDDLVDMEADAVEDIEPGDHVVVFCTQPKDKSALKLPGLDKFVWIAKTLRVDRQSGKFEGIFYSNPEKYITKPLKKAGRKETITITDTSLLKVYAAEKGTFELTPENIQELVEIFE